MQILIVEDEKNVAESIQHILEKNKHQVQVAKDGQEALDFLELYPFDLILLDLMLPIYSGYEVLEKMRTMKIDTPVLILSAKGEVEDKVKGLDLGADDYMSKPFSSKELLARINALSRRKGEMVWQKESLGNLSLDLEAAELSSPTNTIRLGYKEFEIMKRMMKEPKRTFSKEDLLHFVWGMDSEAIDNNVEVYISFLRKKLNFLHSNVKIKTLRKVGYRLEVEDD